MMRILLLALALAGCYRPAVASCQYECAQGASPCPSGLTCVANMCVHPGEACSDGGVVDAPGDGTTGSSCAGFGFSANTYAIDATVHGFVVTDWNGDAVLDIVMAVAGSSTHEIGLLSGGGSGAFGTYTAQILASTSKPQNITAFTASSNLVAFTDTTSTIWTLGSQGALTSLGGLSVNAVAIASGRVTKDAITDLVVATDANEFFLLVGTGGGFESALGVMVDPGAQAIAVADLDGDGNGDVVLAGTSNVEVVHSNGDATFGTPSPLLPGAFSAVAIGDLDRDGKPDVVVTDAIGHLTAVLATGAPMTTPIGSGANGVALGDLDGDGVIDAVVSVNGQLQVLLGQGDGSFVTFHSYAVFAAVGVAVADLDGNGRLDIVAADSGANVAHVLLNTCDQR